MRCLNCGYEMNGTEKFCPKCGTKIKEIQQESLPETENSPIFKNEDVQGVDVSDFREIYEEIKSGEHTFQQSAVSKKPVLFQKVVEWLKSFSTFEKCLLGGAVIGFFLGVIALIFGKKPAAFAAYLQTAAFLISLLLYTDKIKTKQTWLRTVAVIVAIVMFVPYFASFRSKNTIQTINWSEIHLGDVFPKPDTKKAEIITNTQTDLTVVYDGYSSEKYNDYLSICRTAGFVIDAENAKTGYSAFNDSGYQIFVLYENETKKCRYICRLRYRWQKSNCRSAVWEV